MPKKLNGLILKDDSINLMEDLLQKTKQDKTERGFDLCLGITSNELIPRNVCTGDHCGIDLKKQCKKGEIVKGGYHTHRQGSSSKPSLHDLYIALQYGIECLGAARDDTIKCYVKKEFPKQIESMLKTKALHFISKVDDESITAKEYDEFLTLENIIREKYFKAYDIR